MSKLMQASGKGQFWLAQLIGWLVYGLLSALGALPYQNAVPILLYFAGTVVAGFINSFLLLEICRRLFDAKISWGRAALVLAVTCYGLGILCSFVGACAEALLGHAGTVAVDWHKVALIGFANAFNPTVALISWCAIYRGVRHWQEVRERERRLLQAEALARDAELRALRYQITPHFLFNTLNGISTLAGEGNIQSARKMLALLADFLRSTLEPTAHGDVTIGEELRQARQYIGIEQVRLGDRLHVDIQCAADAEDAYVPHLLLQPLVENAIRHGIAPCIEGGDLTLKVETRDDAIRIQLHNTMCAQTARKKGAFGGLGLTNTAARLTARYGESASFRAAGDTEHGWTVVMEIPHITEPGKDA